MKRSLFFLTIAFALIASACSNTPDVDEALMVTDDSFQGIRVLDENAMPSDVEGSVFMPTTAEAMMFEEEMATTENLALDPKEEVTEWWRVYAGYEDSEGTRHLIVQGSCADEPLEMMTEVASEDDRCHWHADFDLTSEEMYTFEFDEVG